jgi:hypothetical protein
MDKNIWLRVIKQELGLLEQLAIGMIDDVTLSREEAELAISRSKIVVKEFEMLLSQIPVPETVSASPSPSVVGSVHSPQSTVSESPGPSVLPSSRPPNVGSVHSPQSAVSESPSPQVSKSPSRPVSESPSPHVSESPVPPVSPSPPPSTHEHELIQPSYDYFRLEREEHAVLNLDEKKDESFHFKALPLKSLKEGLLLNDRYLFQRELFNDDKSRLDETIAALDRLSNIHEAVGYLKANFRWTRNEASEKFVQLVKRRFS